jgi:hypothetical protein
MVESVVTQGCGIDRGQSWVLVEETRGQGGESRVGISSPLGGGFRGAAQRKDDNHNDAAVTHHVITHRIVILSGH